MTKTSLFFVLLALAPARGGGAPDEGMFLPTEVRGALYEKMRRMGLRLSPERIWRNDGPCLGRAMLKVGNAPGSLDRGIAGFGSASFVSPKGLVLTNHHVAFAALTRLSTPEHDYVEHGFVARTIADEKPCPGLAVQATTEIHEVTDRVWKGLEKDAGEAAVRDHVNRRIAEILAEAHAAGKRSCSVEAMYQGTRFFLFVYDVFRDVRMVYAPPRAIGDFGGDVDNWMWPRHSGDFTFLRVYVAPDGSRAAYDKGNVPYEPPSWLEVSTAGYGEGDFCFIMGHPGRTWRYRSSYSVRFWQEVNFPQQIRALEQMLAPLEERAKKSREDAIRLGPRIKSILNTLKNFRGQIEGLEKLHVVARRQEQERRFTEWARSDPRRAELYGDLYRRIGELYTAIRAGKLDLGQEFADRISALRRRLIRGIAEFRTDRPLYDDANMTLRLTYGTVRGYSPRDAVWYRHYTSMRGILEKHTGKPPFDAPEALLQAIQQRDWGRFGDPELDTVPVCFLSDTDITGGNSGSPVMDRDGRLIGLAFDGNYESIVSDFQYEPDITRTINVDVRFVLWCVEKLAKLDRLLEEMRLVGRR